MNSGAVPFKSFVQANGNNAKTLANHFVSYLKGGLSTKVRILFNVYALSAPCADSVGAQSAPFCKTSVNDTSMKQFIIDMNQCDIT